MLKKILIGSAFGVLLSVGTALSADVIVKVRPPAAIVETRPAAPGPGYVWIGGVHRWNGTAYVWDTRPLGASTTSRRPLGGPQVGAPRRRLGSGRRALALSSCFSCTCSSFRFP